MNELLEMIKKRNEKAAELAVWFYRKVVSKYQFSYNSKLLYKKKISNNQ